MSTTNRTILVVGATGALGGGVARHLLARGWRVRALTRCPHSRPAEILRALGASVIEGDLARPATIRAALDGCYGCFSGTNVRTRFTDDHAHGRDLFQAVAGSDVAHFVLGLPHVGPETVLEGEARAIGLPATFLHVTGYYETIATSFRAQPMDDGGYVLALPMGDASLAAIGVDDVGGVVAELFADRERFLGQRFTAVGDVLPGAEYARLMSDAIGERVRCEPVTSEGYGTSGAPAADEVAAMLTRQREHAPRAVADRDRTRVLHPATRGFAGWLTDHHGTVARALPAAGIAAH